VWCLITSVRSADWKDVLIPTPKISGAQPSPSPCGANALHELFAPLLYCPQGIVPSRRDCMQNEERGFSCHSSSRAGARPQVLRRKLVASSGSCKTPPCARPRCWQPVPALPHGQRVPGAAAETRFMARHPQSRRRGISRCRERRDSASNWRCTDGRQGTTSSARPAALLRRGCWNDRQVAGGGGRRTRAVHAPTGRTRLDRAFKVRARVMAPDTMQGEGRGDRYICPERI